jgi:hypothetical protein
MTNDEQRALLIDFIDQVKTKLLERSAKWPADWDGHELRELSADAFDWERTRLLRESRKRLRDFKNACLVENLF